MDKVSSPKRACFLLNRGHFCFSEKFLTKLLCVFVCVSACVCVRVFVYACACVHAYVYVCYKNSVPECGPERNTG